MFSLGIRRSCVSLSGRAPGITTTFTGLATSLSIFHDSRRMICSRTWTLHASNIPTLMEVPTPPPTPMANVQAPKQDQLQKNFCVAHGNQRSTLDMIELSSGHWTCKPESECSAIVMCATHGKLRQARLLMPGSAPDTWTCKPNHTCSLSKQSSSSDSSFRIVMCSVHSKQRQISKMKETSPGVFACTNETLCVGIKSASPPPVGNPSRDSSKNVCIVHGKHRLSTHMVEKSPGHWECAPGSECKMNQTGAVSSNRKVLCAIHGRMRFETNMTKQASGEWACTPNTSCMPLGNQQTIVICSVHQKPRDKSKMTEGSSPGTWTCQSTNPCMAATTERSLQIVLCSVHARQRSLSKMVETAPGQYVCKPENSCKAYSATTNEHVICVEHDRVRLKEHMREHSKGYWVCKSTHLCDGA
jgi:hypothetical protein